jgi:hypothetical protein
MAQRDLNNWVGAIRAAMQRTGKTSILITNFEDDGVTSKYSNKEAGATHQCPVRF